MISVKYTFNLAVSVSGTNPSVLSISRFCWTTSLPRIWLKCVVKCLRRRVFAGGMLSNVASSSEVNRPSWTIRPPWTPEPRMFGAYSARSTTRSHSITRWFVQRVTFVPSAPFPFTDLLSKLSNSKFKSRKTYTICISFQYWLQIYGLYIYHVTSEYKSL